MRYGMTVGDGAIRVVAGLHDGREVRAWFEDGTAGVL